MSKENRKAILKYITECILNGVTSVVLYKVSLFRCIGELSYTTSEIIFYILTVVLFTVGVTITAPKHRNTVNVYLSSIFPLGIYTAIAYINELKISIIILFVLSLVVSVFCVISVLKSKQDKKDKNKRKIISAIIAPRNIFGFASIILMLPMFFKVIFYNSLFSPTLLSVDPRYDEWKVSEKYLDLKPFSSDEAWFDSTQEEKMNALQTMSNIQAASLGIPHELKVSAGPAKENVIAHYREQYYSITFNIDMIDDLLARDALYTLLHECYHAYEYCMVDLLKDADEKYYNIKEVQKALQYQNEFANYENGYTDYYAYADQWCEYYANDYADICTVGELEKINYYLEKNKG